MRLTMLTDYALRVLMMAQAADGRLITITDASRRYRISRAHLMKVANVLTRAGLMTAVRGRGGGLRLARDPAAIVLGDIVRATEPDFALAECFAADGNCPISASCRLPCILNAALAAFMATLGRHTLADLAGSASPLFDLQKLDGNGDRPASSARSWLGKTGQTE